MSGRPFLQIPGPTLVPDRIVQAMSKAIIDHRGPEFAQLFSECLEGMKPIFGTIAGKTMMFSGSGTGAWESAVVNTLLGGERVLACVNGHFSDEFRRLAEAHGIVCETCEVEYMARR
jgi:alanine-glyoxylate transaminase / serine-glyoxylate transaminase / serine-pyruvate transaminase